MEIEFQGLYSQSIFYKAVSLAYKPSKRSTIIRTGVAGLFIVLYVVYFITAANQASLSETDIFRSGKYLFSFPFIAYLLFQPYISAYITALKLWKDPLIQKPLSGLISNQSIVYTFSTGAHSEIAWEEFAKIQIAENLMVLLTADGFLSIFPRQFFKSEDDWKRAQQIAKFKVIEAV